LVFIDGSVVAIALPIMQTELHASGTDAQWVVEGYTLVLSGLMLLCGALADRYGRKRLFITGAIVFAAGSVCCGWAPTINFLLAARILQGLGGTMLAPASLALLGSHFSGAERGRAVGTWSSLTAVAGTIGPVAGGVIIDHFSWRCVFFLNVPLAAAVIAAAFVHLKEVRDEEAARRLDVAGSLFITLALTGVVYAFIDAGMAGWRNAPVIGAMSGGVLSLAAFIVVELRVSNPIVPLALFAQRTFAGVNLLTFLLYAALSGLFYYLPFVLIRVGSYPATNVGIAMLPFLILLVALSRTAGAMTYRFGAKTLLTIGPLISAAGFALFAIVHGTAYWSAVFGPMALFGVGMGITVAPLTTTMMESVPSQRVGLASGINNAVSRVAALLAVAVLGVVLSAAFNRSLDARLDRLHASMRQRAAVDTQRVRLAGAQMSDPRLQRSMLEAYEDGFRTVAWGCSVLAAGGALCSLLLIEQRPKKADGQPRSS